MATYIRNFTVDNGFTFETGGDGHGVISDATDLDIENTLEKAVKVYWPEYPPKS